MLEVISDASGIIIASAVVYAAAELRRVAVALRDLDTRVAALERWLFRERLPVDPGRPDGSGDPPCGGGSFSG